MGRDSFDELHRRRRHMDRHLTGWDRTRPGILQLAETIDERLRHATPTVATPSNRDRRARTAKGPTDPTGGALAGTEGHAYTVRAQWHQVVRGHPAPLRPVPPEDPERWDPHLCPPPGDDQPDPESLAGMADRMAVDLRPDGRVTAARPGTVTLAGRAPGCGHIVEITGDGAVDRHPRLSTVDVRPGQQVTRGTLVGTTGGLTGDEANDTQLLAEALSDAWHEMYASRQPSVWLLATVEKDLGRVRGRLQGLADDLRLWSAESHPDAGRMPTPCRCDGENCRHGPHGCDRNTDGRDKCSSCRSRDHRANNAVPA